MNSNFNELLSLFRCHRVRYLVVGGYAVMHYGEPRFTKDLDLWIDSHPANARKVFKALQEFGAPVSQYTPKDFSRPGMVHQIGIPPLRIDILTSITGVDFQKAWIRRRRKIIGGENLCFISLEDLIKNKKATGRAQDREDVHNLQITRAKLRQSKSWVPILFHNPPSPGTSRRRAPWVRRGIGRGL